QPRGHFPPPAPPGPPPFVAPWGALPPGGALAPPPPLGRHPGQHARLRRPDRRGPHGIGRLRRVPQIRHHVHAPPLDLRGLRVLIPVDHVLVDRQRHQRQNLRLLPRLAKRRQVLPRVPIEHQLIRHQLERIPRQRPLLRERVLRHRPRQIPVGEHTIRHLVTYHITLVQRHRRIPCGHGRVGTRPAEAPTRDASS